jgi:hypothetical protein
MPIANSGHRSRTSSRNGRRRTAATSQAEQAWNSGGVVPITTSTSRMRRAAITELHMKLRKVTTRQMKLRCSDG